MSTIENSPSVVVTEAVHTSAPLAAPHTLGPAGVTLHVPLLDDELLLDDDELLLDALPLLDDDVPAPPVPLLDDDVPGPPVPLLDETTLPPVPDEELAVAPPIPPPLLVLAPPVPELDDDDAPYPPAVVLAQLAPTSAAIMARWSEPEWERARVWEVMIGTRQANRVPADLTTATRGFRGPPLLGSGTS